MNCPRQIDALYKLLAVIRKFYPTEKLNMETDATIKPIEIFEAESVKAEDALSQEMTEYLLHVEDEHFDDIVIEDDYESLNLILNGNF